MKSAILLLSLVLLTGCKPSVKPDSAASGKSVVVSDGYSSATVQIIAVDGRAFAVAISGGRVSICEVTIHNIGYPLPVIAQPTQQK